MSNRAVLCNSRDPVLDNKRVDNNVWQPGALVSDRSISGGSRDHSKDPDSRLVPGNKRGPGNKRVPGSKQAHNIHHQTIHVDPRLPWSFQRPRL